MIHLNVGTKTQLRKQRSLCLGFFFVYCRYLDPDMYSMMEDNSISSAKFKKLTKAICGLVSEALDLILHLVLKQNFEVRLCVCLDR